jgi:phenylpropionate dioxygenase-like ring-hydroxylating dioxygenase large terminal subunit
MQMPLVPPEASDCVDRLRAYDDVDIGTARALPMEMYTSEALFELECRRLFRHEWICVGRLEQVANPGDYFTVELLGEPVVIVRDKAGVLRALSAVCRHRYYSVASGSGNAAGFTCPYHKWKYALDGSLRGAPHMDRVEVLAERGQDCRLPELGLETWLGFLFVSLDVDAAPLSPRLEDAEPHWAAYGVEDWRATPRVDEEWPGNWKLAMETALEGYHVDGLHPTSFARFMPSRTTEFAASSAQWTMFRLGTVFRDEFAAYAPFAERMTGADRTSAPQFGFFPNAAVSCTQFSGIWLTFLPVAVDRTRVIGGNLVHPELHAMLMAEDDARAENAAAIERINREDAAAMVELQRNARSAHATPGLLSEKERCLLDFYRYLGRRLGGEA